VTVGPTGRQNVVTKTETAVQAGTVILVSARIYVTLLMNKIHSELEGQLRHKNPVPSYTTFRENRPTGFKNCSGTHTRARGNENDKMIDRLSQKPEWRLMVRHPRANRVE
jgi:hypothetical protein